MKILQMGFLVDTDASIVKDYQERLKKIEKLNQERGTSISKLADLKKEITQKKEEWLQPLRSLIDRINQNFGTFFQNMGCAGEVSLCHTDDEVNNFNNITIIVLNNKLHIYFNF
jgi:chromosome segregation ATPase